MAGDTVISRIGEGKGSADYGLLQGSNDVEGYRSG